MHKGVSSPQVIGVDVRSSYGQLSLGLALLCTSYLLVTGSMVSTLMWDRASSSARSVTPRHPELPNFFGRYSARSHQSDRQMKFLSNVAMQYGVSSRDAEQLARLIVVEAREAGLDPILVAAVIKKESTFKKHAVSNRGAQGLMQVMPATGKYIASRLDLSSVDNSRLKDPSINIRLGVRYLKYLTSMYRNNFEHALIAYNWGPGNLSKALRGESKIPESTIQYARGVLKAHRNWKADLANKIAA